MFFKDNIQQQPAPVKLTKVISGGQTGADIAGVDAAIFCKVSYGGYLPRGRISEAGLVSAAYTHFTELEGSTYLERTHKNIASADGTIVFFAGTLTPGSKRTAEYAMSIHKPYCLVDTHIVADDAAATLIYNFCVQHSIQVLNVAGPRSSKNADIYKTVFDIMCLVYPKLS